MLYGMTSQNEVIRRFLKVLPRHVWLEHMPVNVLCCLMSSREVARVPSKVADILAYRVNALTLRRSLTQAGCSCLQTCIKQYKNAAEMEAHLSSYDHHHKKVGRRTELFLVCGACTTAVKKKGFPIEEKRT